MTGKQSYPDKGFTLIEMLVVIAIIVTLGGLLITGISVARRQAKKKTTLMLFQSISLALQQYRNDNGLYPDAPGGEASGKTLYRALSEKKGFGPYLKGLSSDQAADIDGDGVKELIDGWRNPVWYTDGRYLPDEREYELRSAGGDGEFNTEDDITN